MRYASGLHSTRGFCSPWIFVQFGFLPNMGLLPNLGFCPAGNFYETSGIYPAWGHCAAGGFCLSLVFVQMRFMSNMDWTLPSRRFLPSGILSSRSLQCNMKLLSKHGVEKKKMCFYFAKPNWWANFFHNLKLSGFIFSLVLCCCQDETARDREREKETPKAIVSKMLTQCCQDQGTKGERCREKIIQCPHKTEKAFIWYILVKDLKIFFLIHRLSFKDRRKIH